MDSIADSGTGGDAPTPITGASTDREDEDAGMGLLADGRRRREPQTITRPVPVLIRPAQAATSGTLTRPWSGTGLLKYVEQVGHHTEQCGVLTLLNPAKHGPNGSGRGFILQRGRGLVVTQRQIPH